MICKVFVWDDKITGVSFETPSENLNPQELNEAIQYLHEYISVVAPMGGNDEEVPIARQFLSRLLEALDPDKNEVVDKEEWERMKRRLGDPHGKSSNYH